MESAIAATVSGVYLFGSHARGDADAASDTDVLVTYEQDPSLQIREFVKARVEALLGRECSFAEYSVGRLGKLFVDGHLFAWHLHQEAKALAVPDIHIPTRPGFPRPSPYRAALDDAENFSKMLRSIPHQMGVPGSSIVYEAGIAYLAMRNIAMAISPLVLGRVDFSRWSPFTVTEVVRLRSPCGEDVYRALIAARHASQRGMAAPRLHSRELRDAIEGATCWAEQLKEAANADRIK